PWPRRARLATRSTIWATSKSTSCRICTRNWRETYTHDPARRRAFAPGAETAEERGAAERDQGDRRGTLARRSVRERRISCRARATELHRGPHQRHREPPVERRGDRRHQADRQRPGG